MVVSYRPSDHQSPEKLVLGEDASAALRTVDTAPEVTADRAIGYLREAECARADKRAGSRQRAGVAGAV